MIYKTEMDAINVTMNEISKKNNEDLAEKMSVK